MDNNTRKEIDFLISLMRGDVPGRTDLDIKKLLQVIRFHHIINEVIDYINLPEAIGLPEAARTYLQQEQRLNTAHRMALKDGFKKLVRLYADNSIDFILFKGLFLEKCIYPENRFRQYADHDILLKSSDLRKAEELLLDSGYERTNSIHNFIDLDICIERGFSRALAHKKAHYLQIDLHTRLSVGPGPKFLDPDLCWNSSLKCEIGDDSIRVLSPETAFLHICWHTIKHSMCRLIWLKDIHLFLKKHNLLERKSFWNLVKQYKSEKIVYSALRLTSEVYGDDEPLKLFINATGSDFGSDSRYFNLYEILELRKEISAKTRVNRDLEMITNFGDKAVYLIKAMFPHPDTIEQLSGQVNTRLNLKYLSGRFNTLSDAITDFQRFKR